MSDWNALQYLKFEDERTRPARDLLARVPLERAARVIDLGCGPGNSTELLVERFPEAEVEGVDSSPAMLAKARELLPACRFAQADLASWTPSQPADLLFANAVFQWLPDHPAILERLARTLPEGGSLAVQMPDNLDEPSHVLMRETAALPAFAGKLAAASKARGRLPGVDAYYDLLKPHCRAVDIWHTYYNHPLAGPQAITEWVKSTGLRPFLAPLDEAEQKAFLEAYTDRIAKAYPPRVDGTSLLRFPRLFIVATR